MFCGNTLTEPGAPALEASHGDKPRSQSGRWHFLTFSAYVLVFGASLGSLAAVDTRLGIAPAVILIVAFVAGAIHLIRHLSWVKVALWVLGGLGTYATYLAMWKGGHGNEAVLLVLLVAAYPTARWISDLISKRKPSRLQQRLIPTLMLLAGVGLVIAIEAGGYLVFSQPSVPRSARQGCSLADEDHIRWAMQDQKLPREWTIKFLCAGSMEAQLEVRKQYYYSQGPDGVARWSAERQKSLEEADRVLERLAQSEEKRPVDSGVATTPYEIIKNPFLSSNYMRTMQVGMVPQLLNGSLHGWFTLPPNPDLAAASGYQALRFNRMLTPNEALYDVYGQEIDTSDRAAFETGPRAEFLGQIAVIIMPVSIPEGERPNTWSNWDVQPAGTASGTNAFGASLTVPVVKFWGYTKTAYPTTKEESASGSAPSSSPNPQGTDSQASSWEYAAQLRSVAASRGYQPVGNTWLVAADSEGNKLLIQQATCNNVPDGRCQKLFIAFNDRFLGTDTLLPSWAVHDVAQEGVGSFSAIYEDLSDPKRTVPPVKVTYTWDGRKLTASGTPPTRRSTPASAQNK